jgi:anhydro-N-acetylmuramic acid kinase
MVYKAIGIMSGSALDGLDIAFVHLHQEAGQWQCNIIAADCYPYTPALADELSRATTLSARDYLLLHTRFGHYIGTQVNQFITAHQLEFQVQLIASHGHTTFHIPQQATTGQIGDGAAIAAETGLPVISDLRAMDMALGGQGAPIVPIGEELLWPQYDCMLNLGGIANISGTNAAGQRIAFDTSPANRVLNLLAQEAGHPYDEGGAIAATGNVQTQLLEQLNALPYYQLPYPKSLANSFGTDEVYPLIQAAGCSIADGLRTCTEHICMQISRGFAAIYPAAVQPRQLMVTGGGAFNTTLVQRLQEVLHAQQIKVVVPDTLLVQYKEAVVMALMGVLRWREENNVIASVTGARRNSINGAVWMGLEA